MKRKFVVLPTIIFALISFSYSAHGDNASWTGNTDATWANSGNWTANPPSAGNTATFNATVVNGNGTTNPVVIDSGRSVGSIVFDTANASAYTIGTTEGNALTLSGGNTGIDSGVINTETINAPLVLASSYGFFNNASVATAALNVGGSITGAANGGSTTIFLSGSNIQAVNTISGVISDGTNNVVSVLANNGGNWAFTSANTFSGGVTLGSFSTQVILGNDASLGTGTVTLNSGTLSASTNLTNIANNLIENFAPTIGGSHDMTFTGSFTNAGQQITINNTGTTTFTGNNFYLSDSAGTGRTLTVNGSGAIVIDDVISNSAGTGLAGNFNYSGTGSLTLGGNNTFTGLATLGSGNNPQTNGVVIITGDNTAAGGGVQLNNGYLELGNAKALGSGALTIINGYIDNVSGSALTESNNPVTISLGNFTFLGSNNLDLGTGAVSLNGTGSQSFNPRTITLGEKNNTSLIFDGVAGNNSPDQLWLQVNARTGVTGEAIIFNDGFGLGGSAATGALTDNINGSGNITINGGVTNGNSFANSLVYNGTGVLTLGGAGTYSGTTSLSSGTLVLGDNAAMGTGAFFVNGGTLAASMTLTNVANAITDTGAFTIGGSHDIALTGAFTADAGNDRTLTVNNTGLTTIDGNVYLSNNATQGRNFTINGSGNIVINGVIANFNGAGVSSNLNYNGSGGGNLTLTNNNIYTGTTTVNGGTLTTTLNTSGTPLGGGGLSLAGGTVDFAPRGSGSDIAYTVSGGSFNYGSATVDLNQGAQNSLTVTLGSGTPGRVNNIAGLLIVAPSQTGALGNTEKLFFGGAPSVNHGMIDATIVSVGATTAGMGDFLTYGANGVAVAGYSNHSSDFTTTADEIANVVANANVTTTNNIRGILVQNGVTATLGGALNFDSNGAGVILNGGTLSGSSINISNGSEVDFYAFNAPSTINSNITISSGGNGTNMVVGGTQTLTLNGALDLNNGNGRVYVTSGGLTIAGVTSTNTNFNVNGGTLNLNSAYDNIQSTITVGGLASSVLTTNATNAISGSSSLIINGGSVFLNSANNYTGVTQVGSTGGFDGNLTLNASGAINGSAITMVTNGGGTLNANATNALTGATSITINNNPNNSNFGTVNINQSQDFTGGIQVKGGVLNISGSGTLTQSNVTQSSGTVNLNTAGAISQGTYLFTGGAFNETANDAISGTAALTVVGTSSLVLTMANNYSGATTIQGGSNPYTVAGTSSAGGTMAGTTLDFSQANSPLANIINNGVSHANISSGSTLVMAGGSFNLIGKNNTANSQEFNGLHVANGENYLTAIKGTGATATMNVALNGITRATGAVLNFGSGPDTNVNNSPAGTFTTTNANFDGTSTGGQQTILGGWATVGENTWATVGTGGVITGLSIYSELTNGAESLAQGQDVDANGYQNNVETPLSAINSLRFSGGSSDIELTRDLNIASGGILVTNSGNILGGSVALTSGNGQDLIVSGNGDLTINANITDSPVTGSTGLTKSGNVLLILGGVNTFTGPLTINAGTVQLANTSALNGTTGVAVVFNMSGVQGGSLDLNGNDATVTNVSDDTGTTPLNGGPNFNNSNVGTTSTLTVANNANDIFDGGIQNASGATLNLLKTGTGTLDLTANARSGNGGLNLSYVGTTEVDGGKLFLGMTNGTNIDGTTSLLVNGGASIGSIGGVNNNIGNGSTFVATIVGGSTAGTRGTIDLTDGIAGGSLSFSGGSGTTSLVIGGTAGNASAISLDVGNGTADRIVAGNNGNAQDLISVGAGGILVNLVGVGGLNGNTQTILATNGFDGSSNISTFTGNVGTGTSILLGTTSGNFNGYTVALLGAGNNLNITETLNALTSTTLYYSGNNSVGGTVTGGTSAWTSFTGGNANNSNFAYSGTLGLDSNQDPDSSSVDLHFGVAPTNVAALANYTNNTLGADFSLNSLSYDAGAGNITTGGDNNLTLGAGGITDSAGENTQTISTNLVTLGASQTWTSSAGSNLVVNSTITDSANNRSLTKAGAGDLTLGGNNVYTGGTTINAGTLFANGISSTGAGAVSVNTGGTLSGLGTVKPLGGTSGSIGVLVSSGGMLAPGGLQPDAGPGAVANGSLTLNTAGFAGTTGLSLSSGAGLTFALGASGSSSTLIVGATHIAFHNNVVTINDLVGSALNVGGEYTLIDGTAATHYDGLTLSGIMTPQGELITGGLTLQAGGNFFGDFYNNSELFLTSGNDIVVEVVPEPGTWALMMGGFGLLIFLQRRKRKLA